MMMNGCHLDVFADNILEYASTVQVVSFMTEPRHSFAMYYIAAKIRERLSGEANPDPA
jgi:hypothetical protein